MNEIITELKPYVNKSYVMRVILDLLSMSFWYFLMSFMVLLFGDFNSSDFHYVFIFCLIYLIVPVIIAFRGNKLHVENIVLGTETILIEYYKYDKKNKIEIPTKSLKVELFAQIKSSPDPTFLKFKLDNKEVFRFYVSYGWDKKDLIKIKSQINILNEK